MKIIRPLMIYMMIKMLIMTIESIVKRIELISWNETKRLCF